MERVWVWGDDEERVRSFGKATVAVADGTRLEISIIVVRCPRYWHRNASSSFGESKWFFKTDLIAALYIA